MLISRDVITGKIYWDVSTNKLNIIKLIIAACKLNMVLQSGLVIINILSGSHILFQFVVYNSCYNLGRINFSKLFKPYAIVRLVHIFETKLN